MDLQDDQNHVDKRHHHHHREHNEFHHRRTLISGTLHYSVS
ncbi:MAG: hypothetical protein ACJAY5_001743 [Actinomycetes bacterium]|jgi:hypothetical protein